VLVDPLLSGLILGQTLHTTAPEIYRTLIEATAFGALTIINRIEQFGVSVKQVVNCGGIAQKSPLTMQIYADVTNKPMIVSTSSQTCALGAAMFGAVVGGAHPDTGSAQKAMNPGKPIVYQPNPKAVAVYAKLYSLYMTIHDAFGLNIKETTKQVVRQTTLPQVMKELIALRESVRKEQAHA
jgi:L-ribulokinase